MGDVRITYDPQIGAVYIYLKGSIAPGEAKRQMRTTDPDIILDFDSEGHLIGIELLRLGLLHPDMMPVIKQLFPPEEGFDLA